MTPNKEDYLKLIFEIGGDTQLVSNKQIVAGMHVSAASVSEMINKLGEEKAGCAHALSRYPADISWPEKGGHFGA